MHAIEKILARAGGVPAVSAGDIVDATVDVAMINERQGPRVVETFRQHGFERVEIPEKVVIAFDHGVPPMRIEAAEKQKIFRGFLEENAIPYGCVAGDGNGHQLLVEMGHALPGELLVAADSHTTTAGAGGCAATGIGQTEMVAVLVTGRLWLRVPEVVRIDLTGALPQGVMTKDVALAFIHQVGTSGALYKGIEFAGPAMPSLSIDDRMTLCNASVEVGAKFGFVEPDDVLTNYLKTRARRPFAPQYTDDGYQYAETYHLDLSALGPMVAKPHNVDKLAPVSEVAGLPIDEAVVGSCAGGRLSDLRAAARVLHGRKIAQGVRMIVTPASREILLQALAEGTLADIVRSGAVVNPPRCGPCGSSTDGLLAAGERVITNATRNFKGRLGSPESESFLASAATVAASAVAGCITDPRSYL